MLAERLELESEHGRNIFGVLLFQDLAVVPLLIIIAAFGNGNSKELAFWLALAAIKIVVALTVLLFIGQKFMTRWFNIVARRRSQELFMLNLLLVTLGAAFITDKFGLSLALGAFIAGMLIAETPYRHQVEEDIKPFRDVLLGLFFVTTGMLLNPRVIWEHPFLVASFFFLPILLKAVMITGLARLFGSPPGVAMRTGLNLAQAGEFGFVLLNLILDKHLVEPVLLQAILSSMLLSMLAAPFIIQNADRIVLRLSSTEWLRQSLQMTRIATQSIKQSGHVIICGYGRAGQNLARMLETRGVVVRRARPGPRSRGSGGGGGRKRGVRRCRAARGAGRSRHTSRGHDRDHLREHAVRVARAAQHPRAGAHLAHHRAYCR
jgi:CPA2 family monovalent cation:H+ antiporter-2